MHRPCHIPPVFVLPTKISSTSRGLKKAMVFLQGTIYDYNAGKLRFSMIKNHEQNHLYTMYDPLTGVLRKEFFFPRLEEEIERSWRFDRVFSLCILDLDEFKTVNDIYGHMVGDQILEMFGECIRKNLRDMDIIARFGGDEFIILFPMTEIEDSVQIVKRLQQSWETTVFEKESSIKFSFSAGLSEYPRDAKDAQSLFKMADDRLAHAKRSGGGLIVYSDEFTDFIAFQSTRTIGEPITGPVVDYLNRHWDQASSFVVHIHGPWGSGKTHHLNELLRFFIPSKYEVLTINLPEQAHMIPYSFLRIFTIRARSLYESEKNITGDARQFIEIVESLQTSSHDAVPEHQISFAFFSFVNDFLSSIQKPLVFGIDDAQNIDNFSLGLLVELLDTALPYPILLLMSSIEEKRVNSFILELQNRGIFIYDVPLYTPHYSTYRGIVEMWMKGKVDQEIVQSLYEKTSGNLSLTRRILSILVRNHRLVKNGEVWQATEEITLSDYSEIINQFYESKFKLLEDDIFEVLKILSLFEAPPSQQHLMSVLKKLYPKQRFQTDIVDRLPPKIILRTPDGRIRFQNELLGYWFRSRLSPENFKEIHYAIAQATEELEPKYQFLSHQEIAHHYAQGGHPKKALRQLLIQARLEHELGNLFLAEKCYVQALELTREISNNEKEKEILYTLLRLYRSAERYDKVQEIYEQICAIENIDPQDAHPNLSRFMWEVQFMLWGRVPVQQPLLYGAGEAEPFSTSTEFDSFIWQFISELQPFYDEDTLETSLSYLKTQIETYRNQVKFSAHTLTCLMIQLYRMGFLSESYNLVQWALDVLQPLEPSEEVELQIIKGWCELETFSMTEAKNTFTKGELLALSYQLPLASIQTGLGLLIHRYTTSAIFQFIQYAPSLLSHIQEVLAPLYSIHLARWFVLLSHLERAQNIYQSLASILRPLYRDLNEYGLPVRESLKIFHSFESHGTYPDTTFYIPKLDDFTIDTIENIISLFVFSLQTQTYTIRDEHYDLLFEHYRFLEKQGYFLHQTIFLLLFTRYIRTFTKSYPGKKIIALLSELYEKTSATEALRLSAELFFERLLWKMKTGLRIDEKLRSELEKVRPYLSAQSRLELTSLLSST